MADAATEFLLNNLKEIVLHHANLIGGTRKNIEDLHRDLGIFNAFLRDTVKKRKGNELIKEMVKEIHNVVYDVEDIIEVFVTKTVDKRHTNRFFDFWKTPFSLHSICERVEAIKIRTEQLRAAINLSSVDQDKDEKPQHRPPREKDVVGFEDVTEDLISRLLQETDYFDVISIIGMLGLGKTTVAWKIFNDPRIVYKFPIRIWRPISQELRANEVFLDILKQVGTVDDDTRAKSDQDLARLVRGHLKEGSGSFLIVMDDVWSIADWNKLNEALPDDNRKGKVLITSRIEEVGRVASMPRPLYNLRFFTDDESWELFRLEALGKLDCPPALEFSGQKISKDCEGLPLAIVIIGGILAAMSASNITARRKDWEKVSEHVSIFVNEKDQEKRMPKFISLSYDNLPYHLRACFLYLGMFREDYEIPVSKLVRMWIGEDFVQRNPEFDSLEETAQNYLEELINRNLVKSERFKPDGKVKTCRIHDTLRDFCRREAADESFFKEIKYHRDGQCVPSPSDIEKCRRLSIHSNWSKFISSEPFGPRVRSFVCFSKEKQVLTAKDSPNIAKAFELLRVLDVLAVKFSKIDSDMYKLVHMRYIAFSSDLSILPSKFDKLWNIQTLIVDTTYRTLKVKADIWMMKRLRHFKTNASATLPKPAANSDKQSAELQTLGLISVESCTKELPHRLPNLKKLGIRGKLALLFDTRNGSFDSLGKMEHLRKLKLINDVHPTPPEEGRLHGLPEHHRFPSNLTSLTLSATYLSWKHMSTLGLLQKLEVLKLKDHAFMGETWQVEDGGFKHLDVLHIEHTDLAEWKASSNHYPKLRSVVLKNCEKLKSIPLDLANIPSLQMLELNTCKDAAKSAREISNAKGSKFIISIYPPTADKN